MAVRSQPHKPIPLSDSSAEKEGERLDVVGKAIYFACHFSFKSATLLLLKCTTIGNLVAVELASSRALFVPGKFPHKFHAFIMSTFWRIAIMLNA